MPKKQEIIEARSQMVVQRNDFIRHTRNQMTAQELDIIYFWISKIKPDDTDFAPFTFSVAEFCEICGIDSSSGKNYSAVKKAVKSIASKCAWVEIENGVEALIRWVDDAVIEHNNGTMTIKLGHRLKPFLLQLINEGNYTQTELLNFLALRSRYSKRLYELFRSYLYNDFKNAYRLKIVDFDMDEFKQLANAGTYDKFYDLKRFVLDIATREINELTDISVNYTLQKTGRKVTNITFAIQRKESYDCFISQTLASDVLDGKA